MAEFDFFTSPYTMTPILILVLGLTDEFIMRRNPHVALLFCAIMFFAIPYIGIIAFPNGGIFTIIKCYLLEMPCIAMLLFRLAYIGKNCENNEARRAFRDRIYRQTPAKLISFLENKFLSDKAYYRLCLLLYVFIILNVFEAMFYEAVFGETVNYESLNFSKYANVLCALLLIISTPVPWKEMQFKKYYYFDMNSTYTDWIVSFGDLGVAAFIYTIWNLEFCLRSWGYVAFFPSLIHLSVPLIRSLIYDKVTWLIYFQSRIYSLFVYTTVIIYFRGKVFKVESGNVEITGNGLFLCIYSFFNLFLAILYAIWWHGLKLRQLKANEMNENNVNKDNDTGAVDIAQVF